MTWLIVDGFPEEYTGVTTLVILDINPELKAWILTGLVWAITLELDLLDTLMYCLGGMYLGGLRGNSQPVQLFSAQEPPHDMFAFL